MENFDLSPQLLERIHLNEEYLATEVVDIMKRTSEEIAVSVKSIVGEDWPVIDPNQFKEWEIPPVSDYSVEELT